MYDVYLFDAYVDGFKTTCYLFQYIFLILFSGDEVLFLSAYCYVYALISHYKDGKGLHQDIHVSR